MLIDEIKKAKIEAMKARDEATKVALAIVENKYMLFNIENKAKGVDTTDADVVAILQKTIKELTEEAENYKKVNHLEDEQAVLAQRSAVEKFLPKMMSKDEIKAEIMKLDDKSIPTVMKYFKANFAGKCDMRDVQEVLKSL
ncbi:MAG: GatB/YqeY domain-containing protein [Clostridiales bacterium]|nr:GatB/YqeY domain-containing protein [Candidatus Apopatousia equi]